MNIEARDRVAELLRQAATAHHDVFQATKGEDPDWAIWYADYLKQPLARQVDIELHRSQLIYCLMQADFEHETRSPDSDWASFYAEQILEHHAASDSAAEDRLALYFFDGCPFCDRVRRTIGDLGIDVELRNIMEDPSHRNALIAARGRPTVPVLRIVSPDGEDRWMPESRDIIDYLRKTYGS